MEEACEKSDAEGDDDIAEPASTEARDWDWDCEPASEARGPGEQ